MNDKTGVVRKEAPAINNAMPRNTLYYQVNGSGPAVVLISGLGGLAEFWQPIVRTLVQSYTVVTFDHPGIGKSPLTDGHTIPGIARDVCALLDHLTIKKAHIVGHSTGGLIAQTLALDYPERVTRVVMSGAWARSDRRMRDLFDVRRTVLEQLGRPTYQALSNLVAYPAIWYETNVASDESLDLDVQLGRTEAITARIRMLLAFDRSQELINITAPVFIIGAPDDQVIPFYHSQELVRLIPRARLAEMAGGHLFPLVNPDQFALAIKDYLGFA